MKQTVRLKVTPQVLQAALERMPKNAEIDVRIDGVAASIASVIAMAGDTIATAENAEWDTGAAK